MVGNSGNAKSLECFLTDTHAEIGRDNIMK